MYGNIFPGYFLSEVMHHERGRNTLELREGRNKMPNTVWASFWNTPVRRSWGKKAFFRQSTDRRRIYRCKQRCYYLFHSCCAQGHRLLYSLCRETAAESPKSPINCLLQSSQYCHGFLVNWWGWNSSTTLPLTRYRNKYFSSVSAVKRRNKKKKNQHPTEFSGSDPINLGWHSSISKHPSWNKWESFLGSNCIHLLQLIPDNDLKCKFYWLLSQICLTFFISTS